MARLPLERVKKLAAIRGDEYTRYCGLRPGHSRTAFISFTLVAAKWFSTSQISCNEKHEFYIRLDMFIYLCSSGASVPHILARTDLVLRVALRRLLGMFNGHFRTPPVDESKDAEMVYAL